MDTNFTSGYGFKMWIHWVANTRVRERTTVVFEPFDLIPT